MLPLERPEVSQRLIRDGLPALAGAATARSRETVFQSTMAATTKFSPHARCCWFSWVAMNSRSAGVSVNS